MTKIQFLMTSHPIPRTNPLNPVVTNLSQTRSCYILLHSEPQLGLTSGSETAVVLRLEDNFFILLMTRRVLDNLAAALSRC